MKRLTGVAMVGVASLLACGRDEPKPVARIDVNDMRDRLARSTGPSPELLEPLRDPQGPGRIIYDQPTNLSRQPDDSLVTAPFGITAAPDSAGRSPTAAAPARRDSAPRDSAPRDTARQPR